MYVKIVSHLGYVKHVDWHQQYIDLRAAAGIHAPGRKFFKRKIFSFLAKYDNILIKVT